MAVTDGKVSRPIVLTEVAKLLRTNIRDLGRLCRCGNINIWAKYKPTKYNVLFGTGKSTTSEYWKANDGSCGINFSDYIYTSAKQFVEAIFGSNTEVKWEHVVPTGGATSPYRLSDFDGYNHKAVQPFGDISYDEGIGISVERINSEYVINLGMDCGIPDEDEDNLSLSDLKLNGVDFRDFYLAVAIKTNAKSWIMATSNNTMGNDSLTITIKNVFSLGSNSGKYYDCAVCVATEYYNSNEEDGEPGDIKYVALPIAKRKVKIINTFNSGDTGGNGGENAAVHICVYGVYTDSSKTEMIWWYEAYNNSKSTKTLRFDVVYSNSNGSSNLNTPEIVITLNAGESEVSENFTKSGLDANSNYSVFASAKSNSDVFGWVVNPVEEGVAPEE